MAGRCRILGRQSLDAFPLYCQADRWEVSISGKRIQNGHPGFQVPIEKGLRFDQYRLRFPESEKITRIEFTPDCFLTGKESVWELEQGKIKKLQHSLFDQDAIVIKDSGNIVQLYAPDGKRSVTVEYPDMKYLGIWHTPGKEAPYVCLEPWSALP